MKAVIYARYSSHNQREESIEGQLRECYEYASKNEITVIKEYVDRALSGKTDNRPGFQRLIKDSEKKGFEAVIMYTLDRFARNRYDSAIYKAKLKKNGVKLIYVKQPMPDTPEGIILESVLEGYAEYYSANLARSIKRGMTENALKCYAMGAKVFGFDKGKDKKYHINEIEANIVRRVYELYADGNTGKSIAEWVNSQGMKTCFGKPFRYNYIYNILTNEKYIGVYRFGDVVIEDGIPPIVSKELYDKVQERLRHNNVTRQKGKAKEEYLLTTKVFCGHCGKMMIGESGTSKTGKIYRYYKCSTRKKSSKCQKHSERKERLEKFVVQYTMDYVLNDETIDYIVEKAVEIAKEEMENNVYLKGLYANLKDTEKRLNNLTAAIEKGLDASLVEDRIKELREECKTIEADIAREELSIPTITKDHIIFWLESFKKGDIEDINWQRKIIDTLVNSIYIYDNGRKGREIVLRFNLSKDSEKRVGFSDINLETSLGQYQSNFPIIKDSCVSYYTKIWDVGY